MSIQLVLENRTETGKKAKNLRAAGKIPSVIYGLEAPILAASEYNPTKKVLCEAGRESTIELDIAGKKQTAVVKEISFDPVTRRVINIEFQAVKTA